MGFVVASPTFVRSSAVVLAALAGMSVAVAASPPIRTSAGNKVPACVTPERLMQFLKTRNASLDPRFKDVARLYKQHGETWKVRWDYAFFQMAIETNFLTYRAPGGRMGDVNPKQFNFAGIGTTGGGVPGDGYADASTGVLAQIQHLVVYSGERIADPIAPRTRLKQDHILALSEPIAAKRPITFQDLSGRWAVDKAYGRSIEWVADRYRTQFCRTTQQAEASEEELTPIVPAGASAPTMTVKTAEAAPAAKPDDAPAVPPRSALGAKGRKKTGTADASPPNGAAGKSGLAGPGKVPRKKKSADGEDGGVGVAKNAPELIQGPGAEIARRSIEEQRSTAGPERARAGAGTVAAWAAPLAPGTTVSAPDAKAAPEACPVYTASYGGKRTAVVKSEDDGKVRFTLLTVLEGFERSLTESFIKTLSPGATSLGVFNTREEAQARVAKECGTAKAE